MRSPALDEDLMAPPTTRPPASTSVRHRLRRVEGQARGLCRMWDEERPAEELLDQIAATRAALSSLAVEVVRDASEARLTAASDSGNNLDEALALVDRLLRCR